MTEERTATVLRLSFGTSKGRDTYGYTIVSLVDTDTGKRYRCMGGGYDMVGTVFADWLQETYQAELQAIKGRSYYVRQAGHPGQVPSGTPDALYGMHVGSKGQVILDGGCGLESIRRIAKAIGLSVRSTVVRGRTVGFLVESS